MRLTRRGKAVVVTAFALLFVAVNYIESIGTMP